MTASDDSGPAADPLQDLIERAYTHLEENSSSAARACVDDWLSAHPGDAADPNLMLLLASCDRADGRIEAALTRLRALLKLDPEWSAAHLMAAETLARFPDRIKEAIRHAARAVALSDEEDDFFDAVFLKATLEVEADDHDGARATLSQLPPPGVLADGPAFALDVADLHLMIENFAEAETAARAVLDRDPESPIAADAFYLIGLCAEARDDDAGCHAAWKKVRALDAAADAPEPNLSEDEVVAVAELALAELPRRARDLLRNVPILVADLPPVSEVDQGLDPRALGLFAGLPHGEDSVLGGGPGLRQIFLFRRNLDRVASDPDVLAAEIRITLLHETGHFFGLDEHALAGLGLN